MIVVYTGGSRWEPSSTNVTSIITVLCLSAKLRLCSWNRRLTSPRKRLPSLLLFCQGGCVIAVVCLSVCLSLSNFAQKLPNGFAWNFQGRFQWAIEQTVKFWRRFGWPSRYSDCFPDSSLLGDSLRKVVNGHKSAAHTHSLDGGTGKTCPGGGVHCPSASSYHY